MKNQECKTRPQVINVNSNNPIFYPFSIKINKCSGNCNNINDLYSKIYLRDVIKNLNVKIFNLMSRIWSNVIKDLFGMLVTVNVNVIKMVILVNI